MKIVYKKSVFEKIQHKIKEDRKTIDAVEVIYLNEEEWREFDKVMKNSLFMTVNPPGHLDAYYYLGVPVMKEL